MDILTKLILKFINEEKFMTILLIFISCILNILKINILSYITANIIKAIEINNIINIYKFYKYFIIISIFFILLYYYYKNIQSNYLSKLRHWVRHTIIKNLLKANNEDYISKNYVKLNTPIFRISNNCYYFFNHVINRIIPNITLIIIVSIYFLYNNFIFGLIFLFGNIIILTYIYIYWNELLDSNYIHEQGIISNESYILETLNNIDKIIYRGEVKNEIDQLWDNSKEVIKLANNYYTKTNNHSSIINIFIFILIFVLIFYLINIYISKNINSTIFITFLTILLLYRDIILSSIDEISDYLEFINRTKVINNIFKDIDYDKVDNNNIIYKNHNLEFDKIVFENITFKYRYTKKVILYNFNLKIEANNKIIGITGKSGIGKSTFIKLLIKMYKYDGNIYIDGVNIQKLNTEYIRKSIVYVNQESKLFDKKIIDNIFYACNNKDKCSVHLQEIMKFEKIKDLFKNIDLNKRSVKAGDNLSGGQKQAINIINGLISPSKILILDEPTNALDQSLKNEIINLIVYFKKYKKCIIIISHDKDIFPYFDQKVSINSLNEEDEEEEERRRIIHEYE